MKAKCNKRSKAAKAGIFASLLMLTAGGIMLTVHQVMAAKATLAVATVAETYTKKTRAVNTMGESTGPFSEEYSHGIVYRNPNANMTSNPQPFGYEKKNSYCKNTKNTNVTDDKYFCAANRKKETTTYIRYKNAAIYNNKWYDVVEYDWLEADGKNGYYLRGLTYGGVNSDEGTDPKSTPVKVHREFHFFYPGTNNELESFKGVIGFNDFEWGEGYEVAQGFKRAILPNNPTPLARVGTKWIMTGTASNNWGDQYKGYVLWIEFESTKSKPLTLVYIAPKYRRGSNNTTPFTNVNYAVTGSAPSSCVKSRTSDAIVTGGTLNLPAGSTMVADAEKCEFKGWYTNPMATEAQKINTDKITVSASNKYTLYAKIDKKTTGLGGASITTSIEGGEISGGASDVDAGPDEGYSVAYNCNDGLKVGSITVNGTALSEADVANHQDGYTFAGINEGENSIAVTCVDAQRGPENDGDADLDTPSVDTFIENGTITEGKEDIEAGASYNVEYSCKRDYHLSYIIVDGEELDVNEYPTSYKFENITEGRSIAVICSNKDEEADAKAPNTGSIVSGSFGEDGTAGGNLNIAAIIASSLVSVTGIALIYRFVRRSNAYSFKK